MKGINAAPMKRTKEAPRYDDAPTARECFEMMERYIKRCLTVLSPYPHFAELREDGANILKLMDAQRDRLYPKQKPKSHAKKPQPAEKTSDTSDLFGAVAMLKEPWAR